MVTGENKASSPESVGEFWIGTLLPTVVDRLRKQMQQVSGAIGGLLATERVPHDVSTAGALRAIRQALQWAAMGLDFDLFSRLAASRHDGYQRKRKSIRMWPKRKVEPPVSSPKIRVATAKEIIDAYELQSQAA